MTPNEFEDEGDWSDVLGSPEADETLAHAPDEPTPDERRDAAQEFSARSAACDGAEWISRQMRDKGWQLFGEVQR